MELTPVYGVPHYLRYDGSFGDPSVPMLRQRRRLAATLGELDDVQWAAQSRCDAWSVQDVVTHLVDTNRFWAISISSARAGEPTRFLAGFDPVATPAQLVDGVRSLAPATVLERFVESTESMAEALDGIDDDGWATLGEAPPGHVPLRAVVLHALWDSWTHERDIVLPLGLEAAEEDDEVAGCLTYAAALSPLFAVADGSTRRGAVVVETTDPDVRVVVEVGDGVVVRDRGEPEGALHLAGPAVELLEGLSYRQPLATPVGEEHAWIFGGLATVFDRESATG